jgi:hypothetical protein
MSDNDFVLPRSPEPKRLQPPSAMGPDTAPVGDGHTTATSMTLTGTVEANSTVNVFDGTTSVGQASLNASGAWSLLDSGLTVGTHSRTATDTGANGTSAASAVFAVTVDAIGSAGTVVANSGSRGSEFGGPRKFPQSRSSNRPPSDLMMRLAAPLLGAPAFT